MSVMDSHQICVCCWSTLLKDSAWRRRWGRSGGWSVAHPSHHLLHPWGLAVSFSDWWYFPLLLKTPSILCCLLNSNVFIFVSPSLLSVMHPVESAQAINDAGPLTPTSLHHLEITLPSNFLLMVKFCYFYIESKKNHRQAANMCWVKACSLDSESSHFHIFLTFSSIAFYM